MKKKAIISGILAASLTVAATMGGCSLVSTDNVEDLKQVIATVDISKSEEFKKEFPDFQEDFNSAVGETKIIKRQLVSYFLNEGATYVNNYGYSYSDTFNLLVNGLANTAVLTQYSSMYYLQKMQQTDGDAFTKFKNFETEEEKYEYLLGGKDSDDVKLTEYTLLYTLNTAIDTYEKRILDNKTASGSDETRATPANVDTERDDYYPKAADGKLDYNVYTGYKSYLLGGSGTYADDALKGTTSATRIRAYNNFVSGLVSYRLVDSEKEDLRDVLSLKYIKDEYVSQLKSRLITKYTEEYEENLEEKIKNGDYSFVQDNYNDLLALQKDSYVDDETFSTALDGMSDESFVLYAPKPEEGGTFGFVYNILLPFSAAQNTALKADKEDYKDEKSDSELGNDYYVARNQKLKNIKTYDRRAAWFNGQTEYAYKATGTAGVDYYSANGGDNNWLFFENNLTNNDRYEKLDKYDGRYAYNGSVSKKGESDYYLAPNTLDIDGMLTEFSNYIDFVLGYQGTKMDVAPSASYYNETDFFLADSNPDNKIKKVDYSKLVYAKGHVDFGDEASKTPAQTRADMLCVTSNQYKALSAVNELQYAYTTDAGILSNYIGYTSNAGSTNWIKEFEYAAHDAVSRGAGSFTVCAGDYGWHLVYVTYAFDFEDDGYGEVYKPDWSKITDDNCEGSFERMFYDWVRGKSVTGKSSNRRTEIITQYNADKTVTKYENRYKDLLDLSDK